MNRAFVVFLACGIAGSICYSQKKPSEPQSNDQKWEYLVVSFGKTLFETPEKMLAYRVVGLQNGTESISLQSDLDVLGRFGWELVTIVGAIGGDQQIVLKRKYDKARSANEYGLIQSGKEVYLRDLQDIIERSVRLAEEQRKSEEEEKNKPRLINLDQVARSRKRDELRALLETEYSKVYQSSDLSKHGSFVLSYKSAYSQDIRITIDVDLTEQFLVAGNSYHGDQVNAYLESSLQAFKFRSKAIEKYTGISVDVQGFVKFGGENIRVGTSGTSQSYDGSDWRDE